MKSDTTNAVLTYVLAALAVIGVVLAVRTVLLTRELRALQIQALSDNAFMNKTLELYSDATAYNQKSPNPELTRILQAVRAKPAAR